MEKYINKQIFYIDSDNRLSGSHNDFIINIDLKPDKEVDTVAVLRAVIKKSFYMIQDGDNTFILVENGQQVIITIPAGNYSASSFKYVLTNLLNAASPNGWTYSITLPNTSLAASTALFTYTCVGGNPSFIIDDDLYEQMGFNPNSTNTFVNGSLISTNVVNFQYKSTLYIHSNIMGDSTSDILQEINTTSSDFATLTYQCIDVEAESKPFYAKSNNYSFKILDENDQPINLSLNTRITIMVYKKNDLQSKFYQSAMSYIKYKLLTQK